MLTTRILMASILVLTCSSGLADTPVYAFTGANVLPMNEETVWENVTVIVADGTMTAIGPPDDTPIPEDAVIIDASGRWMMPGLSDMHTHLGLRLPGEPEATYRELKADLANFLPNGVTRIRNSRRIPGVMASGA